MIFRPDFDHCHHIPRIIEHQACAEFYRNFSDAVGRKKNPVYIYGENPEHELSSMFCWVSPTYQYHCVLFRYLEVTNSRFQRVRSSPGEPGRHMQRGQRGQPGPPDGDWVGGQTELGE